MIGFATRLIWRGLARSEGEDISAGWFVSRELSAAVYLMLMDGGQKWAFFERYQTFADLVCFPAMFITPKGKSWSRPPKTLEKCGVDELDALARLT